MASMIQPCLQLQLAVEHLLMLCNVCEFDTTATTFPCTHTMLESYIPYKIVMFVWQLAVLCISAGMSMRTFAAAVIPAISNRGSIESKGSTTNPNNKCQAFQGVEYCSDPEEEVAVTCRLTLNPD